MVEIEKLEEKLGEAMGLEIAAQKAVEELGSRGLLDENGMLAQLQKMQAQAQKHQLKLQKIVKDSPEFDGTKLVASTKIPLVAQETARKYSSMMQTYLGEDPDSSEAIEFLCLAEGGEVMHYEVLSAISKKASNKKLSTTVSSILREEKRHLQLCTKLAKRIASK
jgi:hypothetical protein